MPTAPVWQIPEGLRVLPDGTWSVGALQVAHPLTLLYLKSHLVLDADGAYVSDGARRVAVALDGPPLVVTGLSTDAAKGAATVTLDDGSVEPLREGSLSLDPRNGRFFCAVRGGRLRAPLSRSAHQRLLELAIEEDGRFFLPAGPCKIEIGG
jgi:hypothetical protein